MFTHNISASFFVYLAGVSQRSNDVWDSDLVSYADSTDAPPTRLVGPDTAER